MNEQAAQALYAAEAAGVKQIFGTAVRGAGRCAAGVLMDLDLIAPLMANTKDVVCPLCGQGTWSGGHCVSTRKEPITRELQLVAHLNDDHRLSFSEIARKLGPDHA